ncbi:uncharacterized protein PRCAT00003459001 [Priceomyces carsonii]|uniref:uncharacterized protein n=1 Tax=Priceomyces carsonii TaxID=28549 RepID=UPI002ED9DD3B|nr:unnamed protein product [Priceomyces carsonii]
MTIAEMSQKDLEDQTKEKSNCAIEEVDGGYGWVVVFSAFLLLFSTWGVNSAFAIYFTRYLDKNTFAGATRTDYAFIGGISFGVGLFSGPLVNLIHGLIGTRFTILLGNCLQFTAIMLASYATKLWHLYLTQGLLQSYGLALISLPALTLVSPWFSKRRVLANGLSVMGSGAGGVTFIMGMYKVMEIRSVHWALRAQAIISASLVTIAVMCVRTRSKHSKIIFTPFDLETIKCAGFWLLCFYNITCVLGYVIVLYSMSNYARSLGYSEYQGAIVSTMVQVGFCYGRPLIGYISDKLGPTTVCSFSYYMASIFTFAMWIPARNYATIIMLALIEGTFIGAVFPTTAPIIVRLVGIRKLNVAFCMLWMFFGAASIFGEPIAAALTNSPKSQFDHKLYRNTTIFAGCCFFACATALLLLRGYIIARDKLLYLANIDLTSNDVLSVRVPFIDAFMYTLSWPEKRA